MKDQKMKIVRGRIPLAGVYNFEMNVPVDMTDKEVIKKLEIHYNASSTNKKLYPVMQTGAGVNYPLSFAVVDGSEEIKS